MLSCKRSRFTLPATTTYLNCAYMSPQLKTVEKAGIRALRKKKNPATIAPVDFFTEGELLREEFARLINVRNPRQIAIIPSVSYGMASAAANIKINKGENIIVAGEQFPSNYYAWARLCAETGGEIKSVAAPSGLKQRGEKWNEHILESISSETKVVAIANTHWADGTKFDLVAIRKRTREVGALLVVDGSQSVGALPFDVEKIQPDALVCTGYKWLLGPYAIGLAYYGEYFNNGKPIEESWMNRLNSENFSALVHYEPRYQPGALRYDMGEHSNFILVPMMLKAVQQLNRWGVHNIQEYCTSISRSAVSKLREHGFWIEDEAYRGSHLIGVRLPPERNVEKIKAALLKNKVHVSFRGSAIRIAPNVYNTEKDMEKFVKIVTQ